MEIRIPRWPHFVAAAVAAIVSTATMPGRADPAKGAPANLTEQVAALVNQLDASNLAEREAAEKKLLALGPDALGVLPQADARLHPEVRKRLERVRRALQVAFAESAGKASRINLANGLRTVGETLAAIEAQSGNRIVVNPTESASRKMRISTKNIPFWQALDMVLRGADLQRVAPADPEKAGKGIFLAAAEAGTEDRMSHRTYKGPFRIAVKSVAATLDERDPKADRLRAKLEIAWEPRLSPIAITLAARDLSATDDSGRTISAATPTAQWSTSSVAGQTAVTFDLPLTAASREATRIAKLRASVSILLPGKEMAFRFDKLDAVTKPAVQQIADATVRLESFRQEKDAWKARVRVVYNDPQDAVQSHHLWLYERRAKLIDGEGKEIAATTFDANAAEDGVDAVYSFPAMGKLAGHTLIYTTPAVIMTVPVEFELTDLEIE